MEDKSVNELREELEEIEKDIETRKIIKSNIEGRLSDIEDLDEEKKEEELEQISDLSEFIKNKKPEETDGLDKLVPDDDDETPVSDRKNKSR